jgi:hypothetical protein
MTRFSPVKNIMLTAIFPRKTDPPLVVDPDTILSGPVPGQLFQSIPWTRGEVGQGNRAIQKRNNWQENEKKSKEI